MKVKELLYEKHYSGPLYHATTSNNAYLIIDNKNFELAKADNDFTEYNSVKKIGLNPDRLYYLSTSRNKLNSYRKNNNMLNVVFVLNANYYSKLRNVKIRPIDYLPHWKKSLSSWETHDWPDRSESEERIFSNNKLLTINGIIEIHMFTSRKDLNNENTSSNSFYSICKKNNFKLYVYEFVFRREIDFVFNNYMNLNKKKAKLL